MNIRDHVILNDQNQTRGSCVNLLFLKLFF
uniref:Uncharacterized protein n=1 Tax=Arundo donax TaxID=35708 RepID=A0A0A9C4M6_ARUDO